MMSEVIVIDSAQDVEKENVILKEKKCKAENNNSVNHSEEQKDEKDKTGETLLSPPRKKLKQDAISFPAVSKDDVLKKNDKEVIEHEEKKEHVEPEEEKQVNGLDTSMKENETKKSIPPSPVTPSSNTKINTKSPALSKEEREKQRLEKERLKQERQKELEEKRKQKEEEKKKKEEERLQKQAEKEKKEQERKVEKEKREQERKEKERVREEDKKKKEEERKKKEELREAEKEKKEAERRAKEVERDKKEAEKKLEDEKKKQKEEAERKKKEKAANQFKSFFKKKAQVEKKPSEEKTEYSRFSTFQVAPDMIIAPCVRIKDFDKSKLNKYFEKEVPDACTYLEELSIQIANNNKPSLKSRRKLRKEHEASRKREAEEKNEKTSHPDEEPQVKRKKASFSESSEVVVIDDNENSSDEDDEDETSFVEEKRLMKAIFLKFDENTRPPYYGTWTKKTKHISGRHPLVRDTVIFNYDVDSDEDWIDEPGEDCSDNGEEDEEDEKETEEDQDGFFVPHGYLSDDEGVDDCDSDDEENDDNEATRAPLSKEAADGLREQEKLKSKVNSLEVVFKKKFKPRKPICIGIKFTNKLEDLDPILKEYLKISMFKSKGENEATGGEEGYQDIDDSKGSKETNNTPEVGSSVPQIVPEEAMPFLLQLLHGNSTSREKMVQKFKSYWIDYIKVNELTHLRSTISKKQILKRIQTITTRAHNPQLGKICYTVNADILNQYGMPDLEIGTGLKYPVPVISSELNDNNTVENNVETNCKTIENPNVVTENPESATPPISKVTTETMEVD